MCRSLSKCRPRVGLSICRPREGGDPYAVSKRCGADFEQSTSCGVWVPAFAGTTRSIQPNVSGCSESSSEPTLSSARAALLLRLLDVFHRTRDHRRPGAEFAQRLPFDGVALHVGRRDAVAERAGRVVLRDHPGRGPEEIGGLARRVAAVARRQLAAIRKLDLDRLDAGRVERLALRIAHADAEHDVLATLELAGQHADRAGRAERRVAAHDVAFDKQFLDVLRLRRDMSDKGGERNCNSKRYLRGLHQNLPGNRYRAAAEAGTAWLSI